MANATLSIDAISLPAVEELVASFKNKLDSRNAIEPKLLAQRPNVMSGIEGKIFMHDPIEHLGQDTINAIGKEMQLWSQIQNAREGEEKTATKLLKLEMQRNEKMREKPTLEILANSLPNDKAALRTWVIYCIAAVFVSLGDAVTAYPSLRVINDILPAIILSAVLAVLVGFSHFAYLPWVKKATGAVERYFKIGVILFVASCFFGFIALVRVSGLNGVVNIDPSFQSMAASQVSPLSIAVISLVLFIVVFALGMTFYISKDECKQIRRYIETTEKIAQLALDLSEVNDSYQRLDHAMNKRKAEVRQLTNYYMATLHTITSIAKAGRSEFKRLYAQFKGCVPEWYANDPEFNFKDNINIFNENN